MHQFGVVDVGMLHLQVHVGVLHHGRYLSCTFCVGLSGTVLSGVMVISKVVDKVIGL
jgi:uncharacterized membrane protein